MKAMTKDVIVNSPTMDQRAARRLLREYAISGGGWIDVLMLPKRGMCGRYFRTKGRR